MHLAWLPIGPLAARRLAGARTVVYPRMEKKKERAETAKKWQSRFSYWCKSGDFLAHLRGL